MKKLICILVGILAPFLASAINTTNFVAITFGSNSLNLMVWDNSGSATNAFRIPISLLFSNQTAAGTWTFTDTGTSIDAAGDISGATVTATDGGTNELGETRISDNLSVDGVIQTLSGSMTLQTDNGGHRDMTLKNANGGIFRIQNQSGGTRNGVIRFDSLFAGAKLGEFQFSMSNQVFFTIGGNTNGFDIYAGASTGRRLLSYTNGTWNVFTPIAAPTNTANFTMRTNGLPGSVPNFDPALLYTNLSQRAFVACNAVFAVNTNSDVVTLNLLVDEDGDFTPELTIGTFSISDSFGAQTVSATVSGFIQPGQVFKFDKSEVGGTVTTSSARGLWVLQ